MSIASILYQLIFMPIQIVFENIYYIIGFKLTHDPGLSIIALSLTVNLLVLPLYNRADAVQEEEREIDAKLKKGVDHIKKVFKGDEQLMMLQTYYRQNNYSPFDMVRGSASLFLEIPFFVAAYQFLSHLSILEKASLGPIKDLSMPDGLLCIGDMTINVLPIIMTLINLLATGLFVKGMDKRTKCQLYGLALFFLIFLYQSPAGLVFYWTLNNIFNLGKTIVYKIKGNPVLNRVEKKTEVKPKTRMFMAGAAFLAILSGLFIPSTVLSASPQEFIIWGFFENPLWYLVSSFAIGVGTFVIWLGVFYWLADRKARLTYEKFVWVFSIVAVLTFMIWGKNSSVLTDTLVISNGLQNTHMTKMFNTLMVIAVGVAIHYLWKSYRQRIYEIVLLGCVALLGMSCFNIYNINQLVSTAQANRNVGDAVAANPDKGKILLSKNGKNVIVLMLDRAQGEYVPYIFKEKPELKQQFDGFTYYDNTLSYGEHTMFGAVALFGGYEYTPVEMNSRSDKLLKDKHNEAMLLLPRIFSEHGYKATVANLPLVNYQWVPDYTPFKDYSDICIENFEEPLHKIVSQENLEETVDKNKRNFFCYGFIKIIPTLIENNFYAYGSYCRFDRVKSQEIKSPVVSNGYPTGSMDLYQALGDLSERTKLIEQGNTYLGMVNDLTHDSALFQMPDYTIEKNVDNSSFFNKKNYTVDGHTLLMDNGSQVGSYHVNMAAFMKLGQWFDYLREQGVYDNTRIIVVADHGSASHQIPEMMNESTKLDATAYFPLLMVKDFNSHGFRTDNQFMTNADVPVLALTGIINSPVNPFTNNPITNTAKQGMQYVLDSTKYELRYNEGNAFAPARWFSVHDNIWDMNNWQLEKEEAEMPY